MLKSRIQESNKNNNIWPGDSRTQILLTSVALSSHWVWEYKIPKEDASQGCRQYLSPKDANSSLYFLVRSFYQCFFSVKQRPFWITKMHSSFNQHATTVLAMSKLKWSRLPKLVPGSTQTVMVSFGPNGISAICLKVHHVVLEYDLDCEYVDRTRVLPMCKKCATILG